MKLSKEEFNAFQPCGSFVLLEPVVKMDVMKYGALELQIDPTWKPEHHQNVICKVIAIPQQLLYSRKMDPNVSMPWKTKRNILPEDVVWVNYMGVIKSERIVCENKTYFLVPYERLYLKKVGDKVVMLNGFCLIEPILDDGVDEKALAMFKKYGVIIPGTVKKDSRFGIVKHVGDPNEEYWDQCYYDDDIIAVGDKVMMRRKDNKSLESPSHQHFDGSRYWVVQRRRIAGVFKEIDDDPIE